MAYLASFAWGVCYALGLSLAFAAVPRVRARHGAVWGAAVVLVCFGLFLLTLAVPRVTGLFDDSGWFGVVLFGAGILCVEVPMYRRGAAVATAARQERFDNSEAFRDDDFFESPEAAALSGWAPAAKAHVLRTDHLSERSATVHVDTVPSHPMAVSCERTDRGWIWTSDVSA